MAAVQGAFSALLAPGLRKVFFQRYDSMPEVYSRVYNVLSSTRKYEDDQGITGFGVIPEKTESAAIQYEDPVQAYTKRYTHLIYGLGFRVSEQMYRNDQYRVMSRMSNAFGKSTRHTVETVAAAVYNDGFADTGPDAVSLFNTAHPLKHGGTSANHPTTDADLSVASLEAAVTAFRNMRDDNNIRIAVKPTVLLVSPSDEFTALKILQSTNEPWVMTNTKNVIANRGIAPVVWDYLTDADAWYLLAPNDDREFNFFWRLRPRFANSDDFDTGDAKYKVNMEFSCGYSDWRGAYGTSGG